MERATNEVRDNLAEKLGRIKEMKANARQSKMQYAVLNKKYNDQTGAFKQQEKKYMKKINQFMDSQERCSQLLKENGIV